MMCKKRGTEFLLVLLLLCFTAVAASGEAAEELEAPFGLTWGMSVGQVRALGIEITPLDDEKGASFSATRLPKMLSDVERVRLNFGFDDKLFKIVAASKSYENDPYGLDVRARYGQLKELLGDKYGKGSSIERLGSSIYREPRHFIYGLYSGESWWLTTYEKGKVEIELSIRGLSTDTGFWVGIFTRTDLEEAYEQALADKERGAL